MTKPFFDLRGSHNPHRWHLPLTPPICVGPPEHLFMYGGIGLAASISALEQTCGRPVVWATAAIGATRAHSSSRPGTFSSHGSHPGRHRSARTARHATRHPSRS